MHKLHERIFRHLPQKTFASKRCLIDVGPKVLAIWVRLLPCSFSQQYCSSGHTKVKAWWRREMKTFSALLVLCVGNSPVTAGEFPSQRPVTRSFDILFDLRLNKRLSKRPRRRWLWRHYNVTLTSQSDDNVGLMTTDAHSWFSVQRVYQLFIGTLLKYIFWSNDLTPGNLFVYIAENTTPTLWCLRIKWPVRLISSIGMYWRAFLVGHRHISILFCETTRRASDVRRRQGQVVSPT